MEEVKFVVGKNDRDNWRLYRESGQDSTIFHLDKFSSSYVIVEVPVDKLTPAQILDGARLCKSHSKYRDVPKIGVMYTSRSNTHLGDKVGEFIVKSNRKRRVVVV